MSTTDRPLGTCLLGLATCVWGCDLWSAPLFHVKHLFLAGGDFWTGPKHSSTSIFVRSTKRTWITFESGICLNERHDGPCSPVTTSQVIDWSTAKCFRHAVFICWIVNSSNSYGTNTLAPTLEYFWAFPDTSALSRWTVIKSASDAHPLSFCLPFPCLSLGPFAFPSS